MLIPALKLIRFPNTLSAAANVLAGAGLAAAATGRALPALSLSLGALGAMAFYGFGMALNDWYDRSKDAVLHPQRPIPSGKISPRAALTIAFSLLVAGLVCFALAEPCMLLAAAPLALAIVAYNGPLKSQPLLAATAMGLCRASAALAGLFLGGLAEVELQSPVLPFLLGFPAAYLLLITMVTAVSQQEEAESTETLTPLAILCGLGFLLPVWGSPRWIVAGVALLLAVFVGRVGLGPKAKAGLVVKNAIFSLPLFDALWVLDSDPRLAIACVLIYLLGFPLRSLLAQRSS